MGGGASCWRRAAKKIGFSCTSSATESPSSQPTKIISSWAVENVEEIHGEKEASSSSAAKSLCAICLETLGNGDTAMADGVSTIFTAECTHTFHFICIASNVKHGNVTCPICRASWAHLPRDLSLCQQMSDPILRILDDSIATSRVNRRSSARTTRYDDDDPVEPEASPDRPRFHLSLAPVPHFLGLGLSPCEHSMLMHSHQLAISSLVSQQSASQSVQKSFYLSAKLSYQQATDLVLVAIPNGPHLRLLKQSMALAIFSLRPVDRLAIVTCSSAATRAFPLRRMSSHGKRMALQVIDRLFYLGEADPMEGLVKGVKILEDRTHRNPVSCILHLSDSPTQALDMQIPYPIHRFHVGFGFGAWNGFVMHEFEEFLLRLLGGVIREAQLGIGEEGGWIMLGELKGGEERRIPVDLRGGSGFVRVAYSYIEGAAEQQLVTGEMAVEIADKSERDASEDLGVGGREVSTGVGRRSNAERWDYLDPFMARRWAKHLHGYRG